MLRSFCLAIIMVLAASHLCHSAQSGAALPGTALQTSIPEATGRAATASAAAGAAQAAAEWINSVGLASATRHALQATDAKIRAMLDLTGQPGVLAYVQVERVDGPLTAYYLVGDAIRVIGSGTSKEDVYFAWCQQANVLPDTRVGGRLDLDKSYFIWFTKSDSSIQAKTFPAPYITYPIAQRLSDAKLAANLNATSTARSMDTAINLISRSIKDRSEKLEIERMRADQAATNDQARQVAIELEATMALISKARVLSAQLSTIASVLTLASQISAVSGSLGSDTPKSALSAVSSEELTSSISTLAKDSNDHLNSLNIISRTLSDKGEIISVELIQVLNRHHYPVNDVPQLDLRKP